MVFGVRRCCRLCFVRLSSADPCSVRSFVRQGWAPLVLFFVLFGKLCFVRSYVEFPFMQGLSGSGLCSAYLALFSLLLLRPILFCILFGHACFACHLAFVRRFVRDGVFCSAFSSETMNVLTRVGRFVRRFDFFRCCVRHRRSVNGG